MKISFRLEEKEDHRSVENLIRESFWNVYRPGCSEHYVMHVLRHDPAFIPELDFVAEYQGRVIGCVMYTAAALIDEEGCEKPVLSMGPLCVHPDFQRQGIGKALLEHTFALALEMGCDTVINFGNPDNYVARGYKSCKKFNVSLGGNFPAALLVKELVPGVLSGRKWEYLPNDADAPCDDEEAVARFDADFPPKEKAWQPSQEEFYIHCHSAITW